MRAKSSSPFQSNRIGWSLRHAADELVRAQMAEPIDDYADSVGKVRVAFEHMDGNQPGDPVRAALAILRAVRQTQQTVVPSLGPGIGR